MADTATSLGVRRSSIRRASGSRLHRGRRTLAAALFAPTLLVVGIFVYGFIAFTLRVSVSKDYNPLNRDLTATPGLLDNYAELMATPRFQASLRNIIIFTIAVLVVSVVVGMVLALIVDKTVRASGLFRSIYLLPYALSFIVTGVVWRWIFTPETGINLLLQASGVSGLYQSVTGEPLKPGWITDPTVAGSVNDLIAAVFPGAADFLQAQLGIPLALIPVVVAASWQLSGFAMAMFLAGLGGIPEEIKEASRVDGAGAWRGFWNITFPLLRPTIVIALVLLGHVALKSFDLFYAMVGSGPGFATDIPGIFVYDQMFRALNYNIGAAASIVMLVLVSVVVVPYLARTYAREDA
ncbi:MAG: sugar ABC transporter permease [Microbacteriaceae bacterium]|nr:MAG: sugar ABC transporter permease [Microbacteriaceae bacterium]